MQPIIYRPAEISNWLEMGAQTVRKASSFESPEDIKSALSGAVGALLGQGKGVMAELSRMKLSSLEYRLLDDRIERPQGAMPRSVMFEDIKRIDALKGCEYKIVCVRESSFVIKPYAWLSVGGVHVPMGWLREGLEVPYELLIEEISARSKATVRV